MEIRKVQKTGGSSYVVTLPKDWIRSLGIKEKDSLALVTQPDGTILVSADINRDKTKRNKEINIERDTDVNYLIRSLIGSYIMGFTTIKICSNSKKFNPRIRRSILDFIRSVIGFEIIDETLNTLTIKDLLNPSEMPFDKSIKRMDISVRTMHEDAILALKNKDVMLVNDVLVRDIEINRRYRLIARQSNMILHDVVLAQKMGVSLEDAHHYFLISKQLERVGDHAKNIARSVLELIKNDLNDDLIENISEASKFSLNSLKNCLEAWAKRDLSMAHDNIEKTRKLRKMCEKITHSAVENPEISVALSYIAESIGRTGEYAINIAEIVFDNLLKD
ncbi:MAG: AbrB/MazE/SpoVT family DNA-binding domain-containing protein [Candidatus Lokiarchaeota archaeon]|nr:AbrB/MazE/SpoVT family DNA-binding domain-containing protein [Candidatus Lokiarchaeota archaeon]